MGGGERLMNRVQKGVVGGLGLLILALGFWVCSLFLLPPLGSSQTPKAVEAVPIPESIPNLKETVTFEHDGMGDQSALLPFKTEGLSSWGSGYFGDGLWNLFVYDSDGSLIEMVATCDGPCKGRHIVNLKGPLPYYFEVSTSTNIDPQDWYIIAAKEE